MTFNSEKAIYLQIADRLSNEILMGKYGDDDRIPSVREYAGLLEVNANTAVKAYDALSRDEIIYNKRGLGYFVSPGAKERITQQRRKQFLTHTLPALCKDMRLLGIGLDEIKVEWEKTDS